MSLFHRYIHKTIRRIALPSMLVVLSACQLSGVKGDGDVASAVNGSSEQGISQPRAQVNPYQNIETRILASAERAFRANRLLEPKHDNAYDKFHSVLLLNEHNRQARAGVQAIMLRYAEYIRGALRAGRVDQADEYRIKVESYFPANPLLMDLKKQIQAARQHTAERSAPTLASPNEPKFEEISLSVSGLNARNEDTSELLFSIARRLESTKEGVMIFARNDREGRWIYQQIKKGAEGYRVRGDIRYAKKPRIRILPPFE